MIYTASVVVSMGEPPEVSLSTVVLYWPAEAGFWTVPLATVKPYSVVLFKLAEVRPETTIVPPAPAPAPVAAAVPGKPGGAEMLAEYLEKRYLTLASR